MQNLFGSRVLRSLPSAASSQQIQHFVDLGVLVFRCPTTWVSVTSGINTDRRTLLQIEHCNMRVRCLACGQPHDFSVADCEFAAFGGSSVPKDAPAQPKPPIAEASPGRMPPSSGRP